VFRRRCESADERRGTTGIVLRDNLERCQYPLGPGRQVRSRGVWPYLLALSAVGALTYLSSGGGSSKSPSSESSAAPVRRRSRFMVPIDSPREGSPAMSRCSRIARSE